MTFFSGKGIIFNLVVTNSHSIDSEVMKNGNMGKNFDMLLIKKNQSCIENAINCAGKKKVLKVRKFLEAYIIICVTQGPNKKQMAYSN